MRREKIAEFAAALGESNPAYGDPVAARALGYPDVIAPPTFPWVLALAAVRRLSGDRELGVLDWVRGLHVVQRFACHRPICAGDRLLCSVCVESAASWGDSTRLIIRCDVATVDDEPVASVWSTMMVPHVGT